MQVEEISSPSRKPVSAQANQIARWFKPDTLRQQYILTELLQPPLALRENSR